MFRIFPLLCGLLAGCQTAASLRLRSRSSNGTDADPDAGSLRPFESCSHACHQCFADHYQGCIAYCSVGCEDYCDTKLPEPECARHSQWTAKVAHVFQAMDPKARMCVSTGFNGCPMDKRFPEANDNGDALPPGQPYSASQDQPSPQPVLTCNGSDSDAECEEKKRLGAKGSKRDDSGSSSLMGDQDWAMDPIAASVAAAEHAQRAGVHHGGMRGVA